MKKVISVFNAGSLLSGISENQLAQLHESAAVTFNDEFLTEENLLEKTRGDLEIIIANGGFMLTEEHIEQRPNLRLISVLGSGYDPLSPVELARHNIALCITPDYGTENVAQFAVAMILDLCCGLALKRRADWGQIFGKSMAPIEELGQMTIGLLGYGRIAARVRQMLSPFNCKFLISSRRSLDPNPDCRQVEIEELFEQSDLVTIHSRATENNLHLVNRELLQSMKPGSLLVNTSRGSLVDEAALAQALRYGPLAAAALDVMEQEPPSPGNPLLELDNCYITPHCACYSLEARKRLASETLKNIRKYLAGEAVTNRITP